MVSPSISLGVIKGDPIRDRLEVPHWVGTRPLEVEVCGVGVDDQNLLSHVSAEVGSWASTPLLCRVLRSRTTSSNFGNNVKVGIL